METCQIEVNLIYLYAKKNKCFFFDYTIAESVNLPKLKLY